MKKWVYLVSGVVIGAVVATAGSAFADQIKSLVGEKVTGEYTVVVNGKALQDKGAVINGRTNVPVRGVSQALGADIRVEGKKILVTSKQEGSNSVGGSTKPTNDNPYKDGSKENLETLRDSIDNRIKPAVKERQSLVDEIETLKKSQEKSGSEVPVLKDKEKQLAEYDRMIAEDTEKLRLVEEALATKK
ncbi:stalk domain-containing protein [Paenibacillus alvei]|uniref:stalk domain-containing protein n=1 Tax=Paenibacillus alvei TaxID=44250 RepID=UPI0018CE1412|nr:stalk domain-containing protein [Paenibacillus alvei]MBG9737085.1 copper amine oxidase [Paenibacillus alvei]MBG9742805.1 copper amine oxidase [Paenibacillus alvei]MBG9746178.1 copper amine oxidase [Paenibacillus alvei]MCY9579714.1 copper amine oxidase N-terminal domain-containing protein [Paenibacillus alvei]MCY9586367.1 copper amine oxidase N-terminal domain-containing protein [Paenibacillus alvei]